MSGRRTSKAAKNPDAWFRARFPGAFIKMPDAQVFVQAGDRGRRADGFVSPYTVARCLGPDGRPDAPIRYCPDDSELYEYEPAEGIYQTRTAEQVQYRVNTILEECALEVPWKYRTSVRSVGASGSFGKVVSALKGIHNFPHPRRNRDLRYLHVRNGVLDLNHLRLIPFSPELPSIWKLPVPWEPHAPEPHRFNEMVNRLFPHPEDRELALDVLASAFLGNPFQRVVVLGGFGGTGKTTLVSILEELLGDGAYGPLRLKHSEDRFTAAEWEGKLLLHESEAKQENLNRALSILKALSGQDRLEIERKHVQGRQTFRPRALPVLTTNHRLGISPSGDYHAWKRRLIVFDVPEPEVEVPQNPHFGAELMREEGAGILSSFLTRAHRLRGAQSLPPLTKAQEKRADAFLGSADPLAEWVATRVVRERGQSISRPEAIESASCWLQRRGYRDLPGGPNRWCSRLKTVMGDAGFNFSNSLRPKGWRSARLLK